MDENRKPERGPLTPFGEEVLRMGQGMAMRPSARAALREKIERLRVEAAGLEALDRALPLELPPAADEALWTLLVSSR